MTLTEMFERRNVPDGTGSQPYPSIDAAKEIFKEWLKTVGLPDYYITTTHDVTINATQTTRDLLVMLVDEP